MVESQKSVAKRQQKKNAKSEVTDMEVEEKKVEAKPPKKGSKGAKDGDKNGDHPPPKRAATAWSLFNTEQLIKL